VSVIEATLDDPRAVLGQQEFRARGEAVAAMKRDGLDYDERVAALEEITYPKPLAAARPVVRGLRVEPAVGA